MMDIQELLTMARDRVRRGWTQGTAARDRYDRPVDSMSRTAVRWCATGAISSAICEIALASDDEDDVEAAYARLATADAARDALAAAMGDASIAQWNDLMTTTKADVIAAFDRAIAAS